MATNTYQSPRGNRRSVTLNATSVEVDASAQATISVPGLRHIDSTEDVMVQPYGDSGSTDNEGRIGRVISVGTDGSGVPQITVQFFIGGGADSALDNDLDATVLDNVLVRAEGL